MSSWEKPVIRKERLQQRRKTPSFSSSLLEAIYQSIDESKEEENHVPNKRNNTVPAEEEITSLRRAILIEKWMESYKYTQSSRHFSSDSSSSTDSSMFSSSETESATRSTSKSLLFQTLPKPTRQVREILVRSENVVTLSAETTPKCEGGRFMRTKTRALKIYGDLKKVKQPISPGGKIANFLNSIFNSRNMKKNHQQGMEDWSSVRKSRSVNDLSSTVTCSLPTSSSCLNKSTPSSTRGKSKRSVRFCPVTVIVDEDCQPCGHKSSSNNNNNNNIPSAIPQVGSGVGGMYAHLTPTFKKAERLFPEDPRLRICGHKSIYKNEEPRIWHVPKVGSFRNFEGKHINKNQYRGFYESEDEEEEEEDDSRSCASSDLFELENIGMISHVHATRNELPVYGTTSLKMNQAIARGLVM
ncbi:PREDICTED: protein BIG GRAIN 1-like A [Nicotiana attenuata]|uniref:Protein big grain 1-like a n=1 Tax=Nicotiana attenuata TaxID=49451 RepID=A0A314KJR4_NICAT|nr:PREDICTED: protein BIG GRAIN 1-like A [Nicotiana attenuata]OIT29585.1 protein big grain 1-like a [Nicotiana attenuata]